MNSETNFYKLLELNSNIDLTDDIDDINEEELSFNISNPFENKIELAKHIKVKNLSNFSIKFLLTYIIDNKNFSLNSGEYLPSYARQISIPNRALSLKLIIYLVAYPDASHVIYNSDLKINQTYEFIVTGTIDSPLVTEN